MKSLKIVIVGGVAGGASAAAKARRTSEDAEITIFEKGPYMSFANCGLPYYISGEIKRRDKLILQTPEKFKEWFNVDVCLNHEVLSIDRNKKTVRVKNLIHKEDFEVSYDRLILAPGARTFMPPVPGLDAKNIFTLRTVPDADEIFSYIEENKSKKALVLGGGYIGLEAAEALHHRGLKVSLIELFPQVLTLFDPDMAEYIHSEIKKTGVNLFVNNGVKEIVKDSEEKVAKVILQDGTELEADLVIASLGVRPDTELAVNSGLAIGKTGGIKVNEKMQTSDPHIYAAGDVIETVNMITGKPVWCPLAGPANKEGRVAGANAAGGNLTFKGVLGTAIVRFNKTVAAKTGLSEKEAKDNGYDYSVTNTHSISHAGYYPGGEMLHIKIVFDRKTRKLLGAQVTGVDGVDKRIDVFATALYFGSTVDDLADLDLAYAPPFGSAKDPVNISGMTAQNRLDGVEDFITFNEYLEDKEKYTLIDVRTPGEYKHDGNLENAILKPIGGFRDILDTLPEDKPLVVHCKAGYRGYLAQRILKQKGRVVKNLDGGYTTCKNIKKS